LLTCNPVIIFSVGERSIHILVTAGVISALFPLKKPSPSRIFSLEKYLNPEEINRN
jgi:hypothetical protein